MTSSNGIHRNSNANGSHSPTEPAHNGRHEGSAGGHKSAGTNNVQKSAMRREVAPGVLMLDEPAADSLYRNGSGNAASTESASTEDSYDPHFEHLVSQVLTRVGEDPTRDGLQRTPLRVAKALDFLTSGYRTDLEEVLNDAIFEEEGEEMVLVKDIEFYSLCEHHMLPFYGRVHIAYIPDRKIIGLSKLARVADVFARRLQVQERLTNQIADALDDILEPRGVAVVAEASHFCMMMRGVQKQNSTTMTSAMRGLFRTDLFQRDQFMRMIGK